VKKAFRCSASALPHVSGVSKMKWGKRRANPTVGHQVAYPTYPSFPLKLSTYTRTRARSLVYNKKWGKWGKLVSYHHLNVC